MTRFHLPDRVLQAVLDGSPVDARYAGHLEACSDCRTRFEELESAGVLVGTLIRAVEPRAAPDFDPDFLQAMTRESTGRQVRIPLRGAVPWFSGRRRQTLVAAAIALAFLMLVPPVRAWIVDAVGFVAVSDPPGIVPGPEAGGALNTVSFVPATPVLRIVAAATLGPVVVSRSEDDNVSVSVDSPIEVMVRLDGFQLAGPAGSSLSVRIPDSIQRLEVLVGDSVVWAGPVRRPFGDGWHVGEGG